MIGTVKELLAALPREAAAFDASDYPLPLCQAVLGEVSSVGEVRERRSFFVLRPADVEDGVEMVGMPGASLGVLIEAAEAGLDPVVCEYLERTAMELPGYLSAVRVLSSDPFTLGVRAPSRWRAGPSTP